MDFFSSQDAARRKSGLLVFYFLSAVALMIAALYVVAVAAIGTMAVRSDSSTPYSWWQPEILLGVVGGSVAIITLGSLYKTFQLKSGGAGVAEQLGGRRLHSNTTDPLEKRLLNVVEEMALASGMPVPPVYLLDKEPGINAFAAGFTPGDAVVGVNRGTLEQLDRDELQGVIAHEFSHILNGDMRLNLRLMGLLHGILLIALIGYYALRTGSIGGGRSRGNGKGAGQVVLIGLGMIVIGYVGLFFARLIKAAVSRQREYLADASAIQFTRNPDGIGGALKKIGASAAGSRMETAEAEAASHLFFGSFRPSLLQAMSTHPPLIERIQRIDPSFDGNFVAAVKKDAQQEQKKPKKSDPKSPFEGLTRPFGGATAATGNQFPIDPMLVVAAVGAPNEHHVEYIHNLIERLPDALKTALHDPFNCRAVVVALLLDADPEIRKSQLDIVQTGLGDHVRDQALELAPIIEAQGAAARLPMVEIAHNTLQDLSRDQYVSFRKILVELAKADHRIDLFEFALHRVLIRRLDQHYDGTEKPRTHFASVYAVKDETSTLISALSHLGQPDESEAHSAFDQASAAFGEGILEWRPRKACTLSQVGKALDKLALASPGVKRRVLNAATIAVMADRVVTTQEGELLRVVCDSLDCPMPPLLGAQAMAPTNG